LSFLKGIGKVKNSLFVCVAKMINKSAFSFLSV
jgi:hypothetical protein